jgi:hypothetical protein
MKPIDNDDPTSEGCQYREHKGESTCNKICDPGQTLCPFHLLITSTRPSDGPTAKRMREATRPVKTPRGYTE